eukprot:109843_1
MAVSSFLVGSLLALAASILFGVHTSFVKTKSVIKSKVSMPIYNVYFLFGAAIACFIEYFVLLIIGINSEFTYLGIICAFLLLCFEIFILFSIQQIGVGYATGFSVFSGSVITPIAQIILGQPIATWYLMVVGLIILASSVFAMSVLRDLLKYFGIYHPTQNTAATTTENILLDGLDGSNENTPLMITDNASQIASEDDMTISGKKMILGLVLSSIAGIFMAILPLPSLYADDGSAGLKFFLSFGVGCVIVMPLSCLIVVFDPPK